MLLFLFIYYYYKIKIFKLNAINCICTQIYEHSRFLIVDTVHLIAIYLQYPFSSYFHCCVSACASKTYEAELTWNSFIHNEAAIYWNLRVNENETNISFSHKSGSILNMHIKWNVTMQKKKIVRNSNLFVSEIKNVKKTICKVSQQTPKYTAENKMNSRRKSSKQIILSICFCSPCPVFFPPSMFDFQCKMKEIS